MQYNLHIFNSNIRVKKKSDLNLQFELRRLLRAMRILITSQLKFLIFNMALPTFCLFIFLKYTLHTPRSFRCSFEHFSHPFCVSCVRVAACRICVVLVVVVSELMFSHVCPPPVWHAEVNGGRAEEAPLRHLLWSPFHERHREHHHDGGEPHREPGGMPGGHRQ